VLATLLSGGLTVVAPSTSHAQLPLLLAQTGVTTTSIETAVETDTAFDLTVGGTSSTQLPLLLAFLTTGALTGVIETAVETDTAFSLTVPFDLGTNSNNGFLRPVTRHTLLLTPVDRTEIEIDPVAPVY
jgi:hypothetical protein